MNEIPAEDQDQIKRFWDSNKVPGFIVGILHKGDFFVSSHGVTNIDHPLPVTPETIFQIGSISKTFTAAAVMRLVEMGKIDLEARLQSYLPYFRVTDLQASEQVTVQDLLTHFCGWEGDVFIDTGKGPEALAKYVEEMSSVGQLVPPGTVFSYNNAAFNIAGRLIEVVSGLAFEEAIQSYVLDPIGLAHTFFDAEKVITERFSVGHHVSGGAPAVARPWQLPRASWPAGGVATDIKDLLHYADFNIQKGGARRGENGLSAGLINLMHTPSRKRSDHQEWIGVSWFITEVEGGRLHSHQGATNGQVSMLHMVPQHQFAVAVLTNSSAGGQLANEVTAWALRHYLNIKSMTSSGAAFDPPDMRPYLGRYERSFASLEVTGSGQDLVANFQYRGGFPSKNDPPPPNPPEILLAPFAPDRFIVTEGPSKNTFLDFIRDDRGQIQFARLFNRLHKSTKL